MDIPDELGEADARHMRYLVFAGYLIWRFAWAIACTDDENRGRILVVGDTKRLVADSFDAFVDRYLTDPVPVM